MNDIDPILKTFIEQGTWAAIVGSMLWYMTKKVISQQDSRIVNLEESNKMCMQANIRCADDRKDLHKEISEINDKFHKEITEIKDNYHAKIEEMHIEHIESLRKKVKKEE